MSFNQIIQVYRIAKEGFSLPIFVVILSIVGTTILIRRRKAIVGYAIRTGEHLHYFIVSRKYRGKGYGRKLFSRVSSKVHSLHVRTSNRRAIRLYKSFGFRVKTTKDWITGRRHMMVRD